MRINELVKTFNITKETVRHYRDLGLIRPNKEENGYFDYELKDIVSLVHILIYRHNHQLHLDEISDLMHQDGYSLWEYTSILEKRLQDLEAQIRQLEKQRNHLNQLIRYKRNLLMSVNTVEVDENCIGLSYYTLDQFDIFSNELNAVLKTDAFYHSLVFQLNELNEDEITPKYAIGISNRNLKYLDGFELKNPTKVEGNRKALRFITQLSCLEKIPSLVFQPVIEFAKEHQIQLIQQVTSLILHVELEPEETYYVLFRFVIDDE